jgi:hypothetical protein
MMEVISTHPHRVALKIYAYVDLLLLLNLFKTDPGHSREPSSFPTVRWSPPPHGSVVVKVGTAVFSNLHKVGTGVVIPDHNREFLVAATQWYCVTRVRWKLGATLFAMKVSPQRCLLQTASPFQHMNSSSIDRSEVAAMVADIKLPLAIFQLFFWPISRDRLMLLRSS